MELIAITHGSFSTDKNQYYKRQNVSIHNTFMFHFKDGDLYRTMTLDNVNQTTINLQCSKKAKRKLGVQHGNAKQAIRRDYGYLLGLRSPVWETMDTVCKILLKVI